MKVSTKVYLDDKLLHSLDFPPINCQHDGLYMQEYVIIGAEYTIIHPRSIRVDVMKIEEFKKLHPGRKINGLYEGIKVFHNQPEPESGYFIMKREKVADRWERWDLHKNYADDKKSRDKDLKGLRKIETPSLQYKALNKGKPGEFIIVTKTYVNKKWVESEIFRSTNDIDRRQFYAGLLPDQKKGVIFKFYDE